MRHEYEYEGVWYDAVPETSGCDGCAFLGNDRDRRGHDHPCFDSRCGDLQIIFIDSANQSSNADVAPVEQPTADVAPVEQPTADAKESLVGGKLKGYHYYTARVTKPINPDIPPYIAECSDIIEALDMTFSEGENFKALWRLAASRQGRGKPGNEPQYDADKCDHFGGRVKEHTAARIERGTW